MTACYLLRIHLLLNLLYTSVAIYHELALLACDARYTLAKRLYSATATTTYYHCALLINEVPDPR